MTVPSLELTPEDQELIEFARQLVDANTDGEHGIHTMGAAVGNCGRGPVGPCGRDRQVLFDYHPKIRVILPTPEGIRSVRIVDLMPLGVAWTPEEGTQDFDPSLFEEAPTVPPSQDQPSTSP